MLRGIYEKTLFAFVLVKLGVTESLQSVKAHLANKFRDYLNLNDGFF